MKPGDYVRNAEVAERDAVVYQVLAHHEGCLWIKAIDSAVQQTLYPSGRIVQANNYVLTDPPSGDQQGLGMRKSNRGYQPTWVLEGGPFDGEMRVMASYATELRVPGYGVYVPVAYKRVGEVVAEVRARWE